MEGRGRVLDLAMVDELLSFEALSVGVLELRLRGCRVPIYVDVLQGLTPVLGDPGMDFDLREVDSVFWLFLQKPANQVVQWSTNHLDRIGRFFVLNNPVELGVLTAYKRILARGHVEESDTTGPHVIQPSLIHGANASLGRVKVGRSRIRLDLVVAILRQQLTYAEIRQLHVVIGINQQVVGLDVPMDDAQFVVAVLQSQHQLGEVLSHGVL